MDRQRDQLDEWVPDKFRGSTASTVDEAEPNAELGEN